MTYMNGLSYSYAHLDNRNLVVSTASIHQITSSLAIR